MEPFIVKGYAVQHFLSKTMSMNLYRGTSPEGKSVMMAEYFVPQLCSRGDSNQILVRQDQVMQYKEQVFQFVEKARQLEQMNEEVLPKPIDVFYENGTAFVVWDIPTGINWPAYAVTRVGKITPLNRLEKFLPLIEAFDRCAAQNIFFIMQAQDVLVGDWGRLFLNALFQPGLHFGESLRATADMLYLAAAGIAYPSQGQATDEFYEAYGAMRNGRWVVHNFDALYRAFEQALKGIAVVSPEPPPVMPVNAPPAMSQPQERGVPRPAPQNVPIFPGEKQTSAPLTAPIAPNASASSREPKYGYLVMIISSAAFIILLLVMVATCSREANSARESVSLSPTPLDVSNGKEQLDIMTAESSDGLSDPDGMLMMSASEYSLADPRIIFNQAAISHGDGVIYRQWNEGWHLVKDDGETQTILANGVFPKFMTVVDGYVYYSDSFADHHVYRISLDGGKPELMLPHPAASFAIDGHTIYYNHLEHESKLYYTQIPATKEGQTIGGEVVYEIQIDRENGYLYYINAEYNIYRMDLKTQESIVLAEGVYVDMQWSEGTLYALEYAVADEAYRHDEDGGDYILYRLCAYGADGKRTETLGDSSIADYTISGDYVFYIQDKTERMNRYNLKTGEHSQIMSDVQAYWMAAQGPDVIYWYDAKNMNGQLKKWTKEAGESTLDVGVGNFDYQPMAASLLQALDQEAMYGTYLTNMIYGSSIVQDEEGNWYFTDFYEARGGNGFYDIYHALYRRTPNGKTKAIFSSIEKGMVYYQGSIYYSDDEGVMALDVKSEKGRTIASMDAEKLFAYKDRIYVRDGEKSLWVMDFDGENKEKIVTNQVGKFFVYEDRVYFINISDSDRFYACDLDGMNNNPLIDMEDVGQISASNGKIYFSADSERAYGKTIFSADPDGTNVKEIITSESNETMYVYKEWMYLISSSGLDASMRRVRIDGAVSMPIIEKWHGSISFAIIDDQLFIKKGEIGGMDSMTYLCDLDGSNEKRLIEK